MALLTIKNCLDPVLRKTGLHIENIDGEVVTLAENMVETILAAPGVGLAANQIGLPWRMFVRDRQGKPGYRYQSGNHSYGRQ